MRKYTSILILCIAMLAVSCAGSKTVRQANTAVSQGELAKAQEMINQAIQEEEAKNEAKTWITYGDVYQAIATDSTGNAPDVETPYVEAAKGYNKAIALAEEGSSEYQTAQQMLEQVWANSINTGATLYQNQDYENAMSAFNAAKMAKPQDTTGYIYAGISAQQSGDFATAAENYRFLIDSLDYQSEDFYNSLIYIYTSNEGTQDTQKAMDILEKAQDQYPENGDFLKTQINLLINNEKYDEAEQKLAQAIEQEPSNPLLHYNQGYLYEQMDKGAQAIESYKEAIEIDPQYFDANFNLAAYYYNQAADVLAKANDMELQEYQEKGKEIEDNARQYFEKALPYLEKSEELRPNDPKVLTTLQTVYTRLGMDEKAQELESKLDERNQ